MKLMRFRMFTVIVLALLLTGVTRPLSAQSLADLARQEAERRKTVKGSGKVYTNNDLPSVPSSSTSTPSSSPASPASGDGTVASTAAAAAAAAAAAPRRRTREY